MDKRKLNWITWTVLALAVAAAALMLGGSLNRTAHITLPSSDPPRDPASESGLPETGALTVVEVTPETVQAAVASLSRPQAYARGVTVEYFWAGGGGQVELYTAVRGGWTRTERNLPGGRVRISLTDGERTYIWYLGDDGALAVPAGGISADDEQSIPTYEDILDLPAGDILQADYRLLEGLGCLYVEAAEPGGAARYWVGVDSGLLLQAEKVRGEETVYRMTSLSVDLTDYGVFTLPDGTVLPDGE